MGLDHQRDLRPVLPEIPCRHVAASTPVDLAELGEPNTCDLAHRPPLRIVFSVWARSGKERCHEQPNGNYADGGNGDHEDHFEGPAVHGLLFGLDRRRNDRLAVRVRLGHRRGCKMAVGLIQVSGERAANHDPERNVYF